MDEKINSATIQSIQSVMQPFGVKVLLTSINKSDILKAKEDLLGLIIQVPDREGLIKDKREELEMVK